MTPQRPFFVRVITGSWRRLSNALCQVVYSAAIHLPGLRFVRETATAQNPCQFRFWFWQKILGFNRKAYWPVHFTSRINLPQNVLVGIDTAPGYEPGCYIQAITPVRIGNYTQVAANVGIIGASHQLTDLRRHEPSAGVTIGSYCWLGMGCVILPGVTLGDFTIIGANAVVTHSFPEGHCVIVGSPARKIRDLDQSECCRFENEVRYHGYIREDNFALYRQRYLKV
jgi:acetyltransferase-like isoleucine patch superfamily enzyme